MKEHKLAAIVFTDIVGYTRQMEKNEQHTMELLNKQREIIFPLVKDFGGEVIKEIGDGLLMMFKSAVQAVMFAIAVQKRLVDEELTIRAGIHIGDVIFEEGDVFGSAVNIAARVEPLALHGGICISEDVYSQIRNKDINTVSIGKQNLKGVNKPVEIFRVFIEDEAVDSHKTVPFIKDLWHRRVFQITAIYLVIAWLIRMAMSSIVTHYFLSPYLVNLSWLILLALLPSIILVSYFHGRKGVSKWSKVELVGMPLNIVLAILLSVFVFRGKDLGAATTSLTVENEDGELVERVVMKSEFRKKIAIFNFENLSGDTAFNYLQYMIPIMTSYDISQDIFITANSSAVFPLKLVNAGYPDGIGLPLSLMKRMAEEMHMNYFLTGEFRITDNEIELNCNLYKTKNTKLVSEYKIIKSDVFQMVDDLAVKVKENMGMPASHINETPDLPISEVFTGSLLAIENFSHARGENISNNLAGAINYMELAIKEDPGFAFAYFALALYYFNVSQVENAQNAINSAMTYIDKLPERYQFFVKYLYYQIRQEADKAIAVVKMWVDLYPDDLEGRNLLAERYYYNNMKDEAINEYKAVLSLDPEQYEMLTKIGDTYLQTGNIDSALHYYELFAKQFPQRYDAFQDLGNLYLTANEVVRAKENFEHALLLAPLSEKPPVLRNLASVELRLGEFDNALGQYQEALSMSNNPEDSSTIYAAIKSLYELKGQYEMALEYHKIMMSEVEKYLSPMYLAVNKAFLIEIYVKANETEEAYKILKELKSELEPPLDNIVLFGYMSVYSLLGMTEEAEQAMVGAEQLVKDIGEDALLSKIYYSKGMVAETREEYDIAKENYTKFMELQPTSFSNYRNICRCYRKLGKYKEAEDQILISLQNRPFNPENNYEAALLYMEMGYEVKALEYLEIANDIWKDADADYELAREAKEKLAELVN